MHAIKGIYDGKKISLLEKVPVEKPCEVIVTFIEENTEAEELRNYTSDEDSFNFWKAGEEDIYQDYLTKK
jgi:hypothetical protein